MFEDSYLTCLIAKTLFWFSFFSTAAAVAVAAVNDLFTLIFDCNFFNFQRCNLFFQAAVVLHCYCVFWSFTLVAKVIAQIVGVI